MTSEEITTYLEMTSWDELIWPAHTAPDFDFERAEPPDPTLQAALYAEVGGPWQWTDRLSWSSTDWKAHLCDKRVAVWLARVAGAVIGFVELHFADDGNVELAYFGLVPSWIGQGYGGQVLALGLHEAWQEPRTRRVWVHTCNFDHPNALANYKARGFRVFQTESIS